MPKSATMENRHNLLEQQFYATVQRKTPALTPFSSGYEVDTIEQLKRAVRSQVWTRNMQLQLSDKILQTWNFIFESIKLKLKADKNSFLGGENPRDCGGYLALRYFWFPDNAYDWRGRTGEEHNRKKGNSENDWVQQTHRLLQLRQTKGERGLEVSQGGEEAKAAILWERGVRLRHGLREAGLYIMVPPIDQAPGNVEPLAITHW